MRFLVVGAGAIGTYVGASLWRAGHPVSFVERPEVARALRASGLTLISSGEPIAIPAAAILDDLDRALESGPFDCALFAMKSYDTQSALEGLARYLDRFPPVLCLQNGVDNEPLLAAQLGQGRVIAGTVTSAVGRPNAQTVLLQRKRGLGVAAGHPLSPSLARALRGAGLGARLYASAGRMKWSKLLTNLMANASSAILDMAPAEIFADPRLYALEIEMLRECLRVMRALNFPPQDLPKTPVLALAFAAERMPLWMSRPVLQRVVGGNRGGKMPSFHIDLHAGRGRTEVEWLNGAVVRAGKQLRIPTPANAMLTSTLVDLAEGRLSRDAFRCRPEVLLARG